MNSHFPGGNLNFEFTSRTVGASQRSSDSEVLKIVVAGNFSGREAGTAATAGKLRRVDCDNFDAVMEGFGTMVKLAAADGPGVTLQIAQLADFHPDRLVRALPAGRGATASASPGTNPTMDGSGAAGSGDPAADIMAKLLGGKPAAPVRIASAAPAKTAADELIRRAVASAIVPEKTAQERAAESFDTLEKTQFVRSVLENTGFRQVEVAWRATDLLVRSFGAEETIQITLLDVTKADLPAVLGDLAAAASEVIADCCMCCLHKFQSSEEDMEILSQVAQRADAAGFTFIAGTDSALAGCRSFEKEPSPEMWTVALDPAVAKRWDALRSSTEGRRIVLALPRILMRAPYGTGGEQIEAFRFEELGDAADNEGYLWGSGAIGCLYVIASLFQENAGNIPRSISGDMPDVPTFSYRIDGESTVRAPAEAWLTEKAAQILISKGFSPVLSIKNRDAVRIAIVQSISGHTL
jgi:type VI secretion system protein ImpC